MHGIHGWYSLHKALFGSLTAGWRGDGLPTEVACISHENKPSAGVLGLPQGIIKTVNKYKGVKPNEEI